MQGHRGGAGRGGGHIARRFLSKSAVPLNSCTSIAEYDDGSARGTSLVLSTSA